jgi:L-ascorbate 6-phosphate lactonase
MRNIMDLAFRIASTRVKKGEIAIFWLGQAGFVIKDSEDRVIAIDPYLSDCCERAFGFKRMIPKLIEPGDLDLDLLITSHDHFDHFDIDAVPLLMANGKTKLLGSIAAINKAKEIGIDQGRITSMKPGDIMELEGITVNAVYADHGELAPDALGIVLDLSGIKIYYAADTAYNPEVVKTARQVKPDIIIVPINGQYGNLNSEEAAMLARDSGAKVAVPCHFWTFIIHRGDPQEFEVTMKKYAPECKVKFLHQGEMFTYKL